MRFSLPALPTLVRSLLITIAVLALVLYTLWQARLLLIGPVVTLDPLPPSISTEPTIELTGQAENIVKITLNGRAIFTDTDGYFTETVVLENGYTVATIEGTDRYGRTTALTHGVVYTPQ